MRIYHTLEIQNTKQFKAQLLNWAQQFEHVIWLDSNDHWLKHSTFDAVMAIGANELLSIDHNDAFRQLKTFRQEVNDWIFGYFSYDLKNDIEDLKSENLDEMVFPELFFMQPAKLFLIGENCITLGYLKEQEREMENDLNQIIVRAQTEGIEGKHNIKMKLRIHKDTYFEKVNKILAHIQRGDVYELNFCQEFFAEDVEIDPIQVYEQLNAISRTPFASFLKIKDRFALSTSPERFLKKTGDRVISQPIKGTAARSLIKAEDDMLKDQLRNDPKERSENIMIVDLVRNDLARFALKGSVKVNELCGLYSFGQVHQLISTVSALVDPSVDPVDIIHDLFPMGSMTGAPKISAMKIIEEMEETKRGLYSGAIGYISPEGDFDFNVVIRSILYDREKKYLSYSVGGAITAKSEPLKEYEECLIKAKAMRTVLERTIEAQPIPDAI